MTYVIKTLAGLAALSILFSALLTGFILRFACAYACPADIHQSIVDLLVFAPYLSWANGLALICMALAYALAARFAWGAPSSLRKWGIIASFPVFALLTLGVVYLSFGSALLPTTPAQLHTFAEILPLVTIFLLCCPGVLLFAVERPAVAVAPGV